MNDESANPIDTITSALAALTAGETTAVRLLEEAAIRIARHDSTYGVFLGTTIEQARVTAEAVDAARAAGRPVGPLAGIPLAIKDIVFTRDAPTTAQSLIRDDTPTGDATVAARLRAADGVLVGKTSTMEFALGFTDPDKPFPDPRNPWDVGRWTGGSSSGTASGIAAGMFLGGVGTDTAGSIRMPAAWCGVTGHKPTYGLVPRTGVVPLGWSFDHVGPLARTADDCALLLAVMAGPDGLDGTIDPSRGFTAAPRLDLSGLRVGVALDPLERSTPGVRERTEQALAVLEAAGAQLREVRLPHYTEAVDTVMLGLAAEALAYHRNDAMTRWIDYGRVTRAALLGGLLLTGADLVQLHRVRRQIQLDVADLFTGLDLIVGPTGTAPAPRAESLDFGEVVNTLQTQYWDATGHPALSVPMGLVDGLPVGLQIVAPPFEDARALAAGAAFQGLTDHHLARPFDRMEARA